jgi:hypothetical protein
MISIPVCFANMLNHFSPCLYAFFYASLEIRNEAFFMLLFYAACNAGFC